MLSGVAWGCYIRGSAELSVICVEVLMFSPELKILRRRRRSCVDAGVSYEDRVARRKEEIESLQEALRILNGEDIAFLQK